MNSFEKIDQLALAAAHNMAARQPRMDLTIPQLPSTTPQLTDVVPISRPQNIPGGGFDYGVTLGTLQTLIGGGGGTPQILFNTDFSPITSYNYGNFVGSTGLSASVNSAALTTMFNTMLNGPGIGGGWVWIPQFSFAVIGSNQGIQVADQMVMQGLGGGGTGSYGGSHFLISDTGGAASTFLFANQTTLGHSSGGCEFRNVSFQWNSPAYVGDTAIYAGYENFRAERCSFVDVPCAVNMGGLQLPFGPYNGNALGGSINKCDIRYLGGVNNTTCIYMSAEQGQLTNNIIACGSPTGCTGVLVGGGQPSSENTVIIGNHISDWNIGIDFGDFNAFGNGKGAEYTTINSNEIQAWQTALRISGSTFVGGAGTQISGVKVVGNTLAKSQNSTDGNPIVLIDPLPGLGYPNTNIQGVDLIGNYIFSNVSSSGLNTGVAQENQYGVQINGGDSIRIIGGAIGNVGGIATSATANICFSANPGSVIIDGVDLRPTFTGVGGGTLGSTASNHAILVKSGVTLAGNPPIQIRNCDMTGYISAAAVFVTTGATIQQGALYVSACPGYNDVNTALCTAGGGNAPTSAIGAYQAGTLTGGVNYYGPSLIQFTVGGSTLAITLNGVTSTMPANSYQAIYIASPYDLFHFASAPATFAWIGK